MLWLLGILLLFASFYLIRWATAMQDEYWHIMTIPAKIVSWVIPIGIWIITGIVWCCIVAKFC